MNLNAVERCMDGGMIITGMGFEPDTATCDCCGGVLARPTVGKGDDNLSLCPSCRAWKQEWIGRPMGTVLQNYLIGNVM